MQQGQFVVPYHDAGDADGDGPDGVSVVQDELQQGGEAVLSVNLGLVHGVGGGAVEALTVNDVHFAAAGRYLQPISQPISR